MNKRLIILAVLILHSNLNAQTPEEVSSLGSRVEAAWNKKSNQAFEELFSKADADQKQIDRQVASWIGNKDFKKETESKIRLVRYLSISDLTRLADPKNGDVSAALFKEYLDGISKPVIINGTSYIQNIPSVGLIEFDVTYSPSNRLTRYVSIGRSQEGILLFTTLKRG